MARRPSNGSYQSRSFATTELTPAIVERATIYGADEHEVAKLNHIHGTGVGSMANIDVSGFLNIGAKPPPSR
jgi:hypothetical protein